MSVRVSVTCESRFRNQINLVLVKTHERIGSSDKKQHADLHLVGQVGVSMCDVIAHHGSTVTLRRLGHQAYSYVRAQSQAASQVSQSRSLEQTTSHRTKHMPT